MDLNINNEIFAEKLESSDLVKMFPEMIFQVLRITLK